MSQEIPAFHDLPLQGGDPPFSAWGLWENNQLGALNHLTDENVLKAAQEIKTASLDLDAINPPLLGRVGFEHKLIKKAPRTINDDVISFNTQGGSQWDSFRHFAYQADKKFYCGVTQDDIHGEPKSAVNGIGQWAKMAIAGRGILIDYCDWAKERNISYEKLSTHAIPLEDIKSIIKERNLTIDKSCVQGDILFIRTGYMEAYKQLDSVGCEEVKTRFAWPGIGQSLETTEWLWKSQFAAVAADSPAFECTPCVDEKNLLHQILLAGWGTPIGELFDLETLSEICKKNNRWSFFFTSVPLNYSGAVASPPNALAIF
ncbi:hypothetical protein LARI1_G008025 [Lachnellula arida]|uniref:Cyclase n=1 Tax=Lachnellula arida TaxID=1316785 RepID=A0A8T9B450_9HELO|nr:hypothetical protein LARI1_G008025 [Lachnellula arida]